MEKSESLKELATALSKAQSEILGAKKDETNPFFKSSYADLASVWEAIRLPMTKNGLSVSQLIESDSDNMFVKTVLMHNSGEWLASTIKVSNQKFDPQSVGSAITYARRYSLAGIFSVPQIDDDAESAMDRQPKQQPQQRQVPKLTAIDNADDIVKALEKPVIKKNIVTKIIDEISPIPKAEWVAAAVEKIKKCTNKKELDELASNIISQRWSVEQLDTIEKVLVTKTKELKEAINK